MPADSAAVLAGERKPSFEMSNVRDADLAESHPVQNSRQAWDEFIDRVLVEWGRNPDALEDDDFLAPGLEIIDMACQVAIAFRDEGFPPPTRVVPDGEGGVCFERDADQVFESLRIYSDETIELLRFQDCRLIGRYRLA